MNRDVLIKICIGLWGSATVLFAIGGIANSVADRERNQRLDVIERRLGLGGETNYSRQFGDCDGEAH